MDPVSSRELDSRSIERIVEHRRGSKLYFWIEKCEIGADAIIHVALRKCSPLFEEATGRNERTYVN